MARTKRVVRNASTPSPSPVRPPDGATVRVRRWHGGRFSDRTVRVLSTYPFLDGYVLQYDRAVVHESALATGQGGSMWIGVRDGYRADAEVVSTD